MIQLYAGICWLDRFGLIAGQGRFVHMGRRFRRGGSNVDPVDLLMVLFFCALAGFAIWGLAQYAAYRQRRGINNQRALFRELCRAHGVDWSGRRMLWRLARQHRLTRPADLFVDPRQLDPPGESGSVSADGVGYARWRQRLFAADQVRPLATTKT